MKPITISFVIFLLFALSVMLLSCSQEYYCSRCLTPPKINTKIDTITKITKVPFYIQIPNDTIKLFGNIKKPCPDSIAAWILYENKINALLNQNKKYVMSIQMDKAQFRFIINMKSDSIRSIRDSISSIITKEVSKVDQFYQSAFEIEKQKRQKWFWAFISSCLITSFLLYYIIRKK